MLLRIEEGIRNVKIERPHHKEVLHSEVKSYFLSKEELEYYRSLPNSDEKLSTIDASHSCFVNGDLSKYSHY